ncbi:MAG: DNA-directed RNA polymerase subunit omega [Clostridia bacterium]|nr:DNA-directed RNA polymerase subunit omega [Clostridia bacterium]
MMLYPSIVNLLEKAGSKYSLVIAASKRAREICEEAESSGEAMNGARAITTASSEIANGEILVENYEGTDEIIEKVAYVNSEEYIANQMAQNEARAHFEIKADEE